MLTSPHPLHPLVPRHLSLLLCALNILGQRSGLTVQNFTPEPVPAEINSVYPAIVEHTRMSVFSMPGSRNRENPLNLSAGMQFSDVREEEAVMNDNSFRYGGVARLLHWLTAVLVLAMVPAGFIMIRVGPGTLQNSLFDFHRSAGVVLMVLTLVRLFWRLRHPPQPLPASVPIWQRRAAEAVHAGLYGFLLINPLIGWLATSAYGATIKVFGLFSLPPLTGQDRDLATSLFGLHMVLGLALTGLVLLHVAAALHHHFILRDGTLRRML